MVPFGISFGIICSCLRFSPGNFRVGFYPGDCRLGHFDLGFVVWERSVLIVCETPLALVRFGTITSAWYRLFGNYPMGSFAKYFRLETFAWDIALRNFTCALSFGGPSLDTWAWTLGNSGDLGDLKIWRFGDLEIGGISVIETWRGWRFGHGGLIFRFGIG